MSEVLPYVGAVIGFFTPIGPYYGMMIGPLIGATTSEKVDLPSALRPPREKDLDDDHQHSP